MRPELSQPGLTYPEVGATAGTLPAGYRHMLRSACVGRGERDFEVAARRLLAWEMHRGAGLYVQPSTPVAAVGVVVLQGLRLGPFRLLAPCRVVYVVDDPVRRGFAYGTMPGHPETGEELFTVSLRPDGRVVLEVTAFSRPATWWARAGGPVTRLAQDLVIGRYLRALARPPASPGPADPVISRRPPDSEARRSL